MKWWEMNAVRENIRPVIYCRNSAETRQEKSNAIQDDKYRTFAEMRSEFQELMRRVAEDDSFIFVPVIDVTKWERFQSRNRRRTKS